MSARLMISAPSGRCGKTIVSIGLCASLRKRGLVVQPFKKGPDYIDPSWLTAASKRPCRNLDLFMMKKHSILKSFCSATKDADIAVIEANMGFYDGIKKDGSDSPASLARLLSCPVILVVNCTRMTRSVAALIKGYLEFEQENCIKGVILNNVSGERHERKLLDSIKRYCKIPVLGVIPRSSVLGIKERHLGLIHFSEEGYGTELISHIADYMERYMDMERIIAIARDAPEIPYEPSREKNKNIQVEEQLKIGVLYDKVFSFYYPENLEALISEGAELIFLNSTKDELPSDVNGLYIGGGFPELYANELAGNRSLLKQIKNAIENYMPVYCECAGLMYLSEGIKTDSGFFEMVGVIPSRVEKKVKPQGHGYMEAEVVEENPFFERGKKIRGHEFHYSTLTGIRGLRYALKLKRGYGIDGSYDGILYKNMFASYMHIHASGIPEWAKNFVKATEGYKRNNFYMNRFEKRGVYSHVR